MIITTHVRADGDALGSAMGLQRILQSQGKDVRVLLHETVLPRYGFLLDHGAVEIWEASRALQDLARADLCVIVDTCARTQLGDVIDAIETSSTRTLAIDHHISRDASVQELWANEKAAACAGMIAELAREAGWPIDPTTAMFLYVGLATDTGWFRFSNADPIAYEVASRLVAAGAQPADLYQRLYLSDTPPRVRLIGEVLKSFELLADERLAVIKVTREMLKGCGASQQMTEDIINEPARIGSVIAVVMLVESNDQKIIRVSLRSKQDVDVAAVAKQFGGGGHARASGAKMEGTLDQVAQRVVGSLTKALRA